MKNKPRKGTFGYMEAQKKRVLLRTILFFGLSLAIYLIGYISTGSNQNYLTIVAVLGCLPASKSAVNVVMFYRYHGCSAEDRAKIKEHTKGLSGLYDMVFTSYEKNFEIHHITVKGGVVAGYSANPKCDAAACEKHLRTILAQNGLKTVVKIFSDVNKYTNRLDQLAGFSEEEIETNENGQIEEADEKSAVQQREAEIIDVLMAISL